MTFFKVVKNFLSISLIQGINYLVPLFILPYLVKVVGIANFGISNYVLSLFIALKVIIDYGYNISGVKDIAEAKQKNSPINSIFSKVFFSKIYLLAIAFFLVVVACLAIPIAREYSILLLCSFVVIVGQSLMPIWFYQAVEKSEVVVIFSLITRALYLFLIFNYVSRPSDFIFINLFLGLADVLLSIICLVFIFYKYKIQLQLLSFIGFKQELKNNFVYARSNIYVTIALTSPFMILGFFANSLTLGYYGIADKIIQVLRTSASILHSATFPRVIDLYNQGFGLFKNFIRRLHIFLLIFYIAIFVACFFFSETIVQIITNTKQIHKETEDVLKVLAIVPLIAALELLPTHLLLIENKQKKYASVLFFAALFSVFIAVIFAIFFNYIGAAFSYLLVEIFILIFLYLSNTKTIQAIFLNKKQF